MEESVRSGQDVGIRNGEVQSRYGHGSSTVLTRYGMDP